MHPRHGLVQQPNLLDDDESWHLYWAMQAQKGPIQGGWSVRERRKKYPHGIPPRLSTEYQDFVEANENPEWGRALFNRRGMMLEQAVDELSTEISGWDSCVGRPWGGRHDYRYLYGG
jgi:hypothetical protein